MKIKDVKNIFMNIYKDGKTLITPKVMSENYE
jgi:hypothetical protein